MKKKQYENPAMTVVELQHTQMLMHSGVDADRSGYGTANEQSWGDESGVKELKDPDFWED